MEELILKERKFKEDIVNVVNNSNLPAFIIKPFIKELLGQLETLEERQYNDAKKIQEEKDDKENKETEID